MFKTQILVSEYGARRWEGKGRGYWRTLKESNGMEIGLWLLREPSSATAQARHISERIFPWRKAEGDAITPCVSLAHTIKLFPCYFICPSPYIVIPCYFCPIFCYLLTYIIARKGTQHCSNTHRLQGPRTTQVCSTVLSKRSLCPMLLAITSALPTHLEAQLFLQ